MASFAILSSLGFRNPGPEKTKQIMASFNAHAIVNTDDEEAVNLVTVGRTGKVFRFIRLDVHDIVRIYNNPDNPNGLGAVPRLYPVRQVTNRGRKLVDILYASDGYIVFCENHGPSGKLADTVDDEAFKPISRPSNAYVYSGSLCMFCG
jgi:hypothetical protein